MKPSVKPLDDLTKIKGIGEARQKWLRESFGIRTYQDMADLTLAQLEKKMKADGLIISRKAIETWTSQAREFAGPIEEPSMSTAELPATESSRMPRENGWKPFASFVVEYQTREPSGQEIEHRTVVHYMEDDVGSDWPVIEGSQLCQWMLDQIRHKVKLLAGNARRAEKQTTALKITRIHILQQSHPTPPAQLIVPGSPSQVSMVRDIPFNLEIIFELVGPAAVEVARNKAGWSIVCKLYDPLSGVFRQLYDSGPKSFKEGQYIYNILIPEICLHQGDYRLWVILNSDHSTLALPDFIDISSFNVI